MTIPVYLAGPSRELDRVRRCAAELDRRSDVRIVYRWWAAVEHHGVGLDGHLRREQQVDHALRDLRGLCESRIAWVLWPESSPSHGAAAELGYLLALTMSDRTRAPHVVVTGRSAHECIFTSLAWRDASDDLGLVEVLRMAAEMST
jgi:hypothetical protein